MVKILLVEDNELNADMLMRRLAKRGYEMVLAEDGAQGLTLAQSESPDLILMDLSLPVMDGWEATRRLKGSRTTRRIPVIALTAHAMPREQERAMAAGCDDYDTKPVDLKRLLPKIEALLAADRSTETLTSPLPPTVTAPAPQRPSEDPQATPRNPQQRSILLVDQDAQSREILAHQLAKQGYSVTMAEHSQEVLQLVRQLPFDLVLLERQLRDADGMELLLTLRRDRSQVQLPVIMMAAMRQSEDIVKALRAGANDYLIKPLDLPVVLARIRAQLSLVVSPSSGEPEPVNSSSAIESRYKIVEILQAGDLAQTYLARDTQRPSQPLCVIKHLQSLNREPKVLAKTRQLFTQEVSILERLQHEQLPRLLAYFIEDHHFYWVQDYVQGSSLELEFSRRRFSEGQVLALLWDLLQILRFLHNQQVIHRNIKPTNIIRRRGARQFVLMDFGTLKSVPTAFDEISRPPIAVNHGFAPLEQSAGQARSSSDIYALGMVAIQALTGQEPRTLKKEVATGEVIWNTQRQAGDRLAEVLDRMIPLNWTQRYQNAEEVIGDLRPVIQGWRQRK